jgi:cold-inducible RNA-binding protein
VVGHAIVMLESFIGQYRSSFRSSHLVGRHVGLFLVRLGKSNRESATSHWRIVVGNKLYCGNLSYNVNSSDLESLFSEFGDVQSAQVITDRDTGRSKGFGFVEMANESDAEAAIAGLNEKDHDGRALKVNEAKPREDRGGGGGGGRRY